MYRPSRLFNPGMTPVSIYSYIHVSICLSIPIHLYTIGSIFPSLPVILPHDTALLIAFPPNLSPFSLSLYVCLLGPCPPRCPCDPTTTTLPGQRLTKHTSLYTILSISTHLTFLFIINIHTPLAPLSISTHVSFLYPYQLTSTDYLARHHTHLPSPFLYSLLPSSPLSNLPPSNPPLLLCVSLGYPPYVPPRLHPHPPHLPD